MIHVYVFVCLLIGTCAYALMRGGAPERIVGAAFLFAAVASSLAPSRLPVRFFEAELGVMVVDIVLLLVLFAIALRADRFWPLFLAAFQLDAVGAHLVKWYDPELLRVAYVVMIVGWSYPMLLLLAIGTWRHRRRLEAQGFDISWMIAGKTAALAT